MDEQSSSPEAGSVRIHFQCAERLSPHQVTQLTGQIVGGLPVAPEEVELDPDGAGWVLYGADDTLTLDELTEAVMWLRRHPGIAEVRWERVVDL